MQCSVSSEVARKLLIVDDDEALRRQLRWALDGYEVLLAGDRCSAVATVRREHPPVALLDLGLPPDPDGASEGLAALDEILAMDESAFYARFAGTPVPRTKLKGLKRNAATVRKDAGTSNECR